MGEVGVRVFASRALAWLILGDGRMMLCTHIHYRRHWLEPFIDAAIFWHHQHCRKCSDWESLQAVRDTQEALSAMECPPMTRNAVAEARAAGLI